MKDATAFRPVGALRVSAVGPRRLRLVSIRETIELSAVAEDLFRLRMVRGRKFSERPSWAVVRDDWPMAPPRVETGKETVAIETGAGRLEFHLRDGRWVLRDAQGAERTTGLAKRLGFAGDAARVALALTETEGIFGLGETTGPINKRGLRRELWNIDVLGHSPGIHPGLHSLYVAIPFALLLRDGRTTGIFWDNPARQTWDLGQAAPDALGVTADSGEIDLYLFVGSSVAEIVDRYTELTGRMPLPPRWALGYHQCRYSYETAARVREIAGNFRRREIPCDAIYLDIHHMDEYRVFTFGKTFPRPAKLLADLDEQGFKVVAIVDPGVKDDPNFGVLRRGRARRAFVKDATGRRDYVGRVWPGESRFPDFTNAQARAWWGEEQARLQQLGVAGFWNDMNEPANFALPSKTLPPDCRHDSDAGPLSHAVAHNVYGMQMARASREGALAHEPGVRPFVISRAGYAGVQRYALIWTGDNSSVWEHLADSLQMLLNLGLSGVAFCGADVGGFLENTNAELLVRWLQMAAFTPFFRNHTNLDTINQEPWAFGPPVEAICRRYIELRYQLLPYLYCLFAESHRTGAAIMRPLFWHHADDPLAVATGDQFLLGANLLVAPILQPGNGARAVYLPRGEWFDFWSGEAHTGGRYILAPAPLDRLPLYVRAGAIIPMGAVRQHTGESKDEVINLHLWPNGKTELAWHEDDGVTIDLATGGYSTRTIRFATVGRGARLDFGAAQGSFVSEVKRWRVILRCATRPYRVTVNGGQIPARFVAETGVFSFEIQNAVSPIVARLA